MRRLLLYYLAFALAIVEVIMFVSLILAPLALWLREESDWFDNPFNMVDDIDWAMTKRELDRAEKKRKEREERK